MSRRGGGGDLVSGRKWTEQSVSECEKGERLRVGSGREKQAMRTDRE